VSWLLVLWRNIPFRRFADRAIFWPSADALVPGSTAARALTIVLLAYGVFFVHIMIIIKKWGNVNDYFIILKSLLIAQ
jgi:hypothetical protein